MAGFSKKKYFKLAKGFYGRANNCLRLTVPKVEKSLCKAYRGRKLRRRNVRRNWIRTINGGLHELNINYSTFICGLNSSNLSLNRKVLADLAVNQPYSFKAVVDEVKVQAGYLQKNRPSVEDLVRKNLLTAAKLQESDYENVQPQGVRLRY